MTETPTQEPFLIIRPRKGWQLIPVRELIAYRDLLNTLALRDVKLRYRQTAVGVLWVILQPLIGAGLFSFIFGSVAKLSTGSDKVPYLVFSFTGLMCWNLFAQIVQKSSDIMVQNAGLVSKIYFPRLILPLSTVHGVLLDFLVAGILLAALMGIYGVPVTPALAWLPVAVLMAVMLALGLGAWLAALNVSYRDVRYVVPVMIQFLFWASPVAYALSNVPPKAQAVMAFNPMVGVLELFRHAVLGTPLANPAAVVASGVACLLVFLLGLLVFQRFERRFADVI